MKKRHTSHLREVWRFFIGGCYVSAFAECVLGYERITGSLQYLTSGRFWERWISKLDTSDTRRLGLLLALGDLAVQGLARGLVGRTTR